MTEQKDDGEEEIQPPEEPNLAAKHFLGDEVFDLPKIGSEYYFLMINVKE